MGEKSGTGDEMAAEPGRRVVIAVPLQEHHREGLRRRFPALDFAVVDGAPVAADLAEADALITWNLSTELLAAAPRLDWLQTGGAGVDGFPLAALAARGIVVTNASGVHAPNMAEHAMAMILAFARGLPQLLRAQAAHRWRDEATHREVFELPGQTLLLVGLGEIASAIAPRAAAFGLHVHGVRRNLNASPPPHVERVVPLTDLTVALRQADHVVLTLPATAETRGLLGEAELAAMRRGAYLYNLGRGAVVDTPALIAALTAGQLGGAGLDVVDPEPLPADSPLWEMPNVIVTAHTAGATPRYWDRGAALIEANLDRWLKGEPLLNRVDLDAGY